MVDLADRLDRRLQFLIIVQPTANLSSALATHTDLPSSSSGIGHRQDEHLVPLTTRALRTVLGVSDGALQQRPAQQLAANRQLANQLLAREGPAYESFIRMNQASTSSSTPIPFDLADFPANEESGDAPAQFNFAPGSS